MRFGVVAMQPPRGTAWTDLARSVETAGYDTLVMPDNVAHGLSVMPALGAAAAATSRLRVGTYVLAGGQRHPVQVAKDAVSLALISGNRFELGLGAGRPGAEADYAMLGLPFPSAGARVDELAATISLVKRLIAGETVTADGPYHRLTDARVVPWGTEPPEVPLLVAGGGRRMLRLAAREADTIALGLPPDASARTVEERLGWVREAAGDRTVELNVNLMAVGDAVPGALRGRVDPAALASAGSVACLRGSPRAMAEELRRRQESLGISYVLVADELMEPFAPVLAAVREQDR